MPRAPRASRAYALENAAFLRRLARTGNARAAAADMGLSRSRFTKRRAADPAFAARWDAALAFAHSELGGGERRPTALPSRLREGRGVGTARTGKPTPGKPTPGAAPHPTRTPSGRLQLRRRPKTAITPEAEQAFLSALAATANVRLSARAAGFASASFYTRKRTHPAFAREWRLALELGYEQVELALHQSWSEDAHEHDAWRHNDPPPVPPMTANQALQLLYLHQKEARGAAEPSHIKRRRGESSDAHSYRLNQMYQASLEREREKFRIGEALRAEARAARSPHEPPPPLLPDLAQLTGADEPKTPPHNPDLALFGGWRIADWKKREGS